MRYAPWLLILAMLFLWDPAWRLAGVRQTPPWTLKNQLRENPDGRLLLDARTPFEFKLFHIPGAVNRPAPVDWSEVRELANGRDVTVICMTGHRSPVVAYMLGKKKQNKGIRISNLTWGMLGWVAFFGRVER